MQGVRIDLSSQTASFREPRSQLYHQCLPLPPFSTLVGLAGAAIGISFAEVLGLFKDERIHIGVKGISYGKGRDLWNYAKISSGTAVKKDIITREFLCNVQLQVFYACDDVECIYRLQEAFKDPVYALTLGNSDELALCKNIVIYQDINPDWATEMSNCWLHGNISNNYSFDWNKIQKPDLNLKLVAPQVVSLPVDFDFKGMLRKGVRYEMFSFIPEYIRLKEKTAVYMFGKQAVPMFMLTNNQ